MLRRVGEAPLAGWVIQGSLNLTTREWELCWGQVAGEGTAVCHLRVPRSRFLQPGVPGETKEDPRTPSG